MSWEGCYVRGWLPITTNGAIGRYLRGGGGAVLLGAFWLLGAQDTQIRAVRLYDPLDPQKSMYMLKRLHVGAPVSTSPPKNRRPKPGQVWNNGMKGSTASPEHATRNKIK